MPIPLVPNRPDPLWAAIQPPPDETPQDRDRRLFAELEAKRISDGIDEMLRREKREMRMKQEVKILLLGQSESGKSTTLKQFQLMHSPAAFRADRIAWRAVIYLNLVRSIRRILDAISPNSEDLDDGDELKVLPRTVRYHNPGTQVDKYEQYRRELEPLKDLEERLTRMLSSPDPEMEPTHIPTVRTECTLPTNGHDNQSYTKGSSKKYARQTPSIAIPISRQYSYPLSPASSSAVQNMMFSGGSSPVSPKSKNSEVSVHYRSNWKKAFSLGSKIGSPKSAHTNEIEGWWDDPADPVHALNACTQPMLSLWRDPKVKLRLRERALRLEESSGFFLDEISRITALRYFPTDQDVLKARLKTIGIVEHTFTITDPRRHNIDWKIYDVGGARNQRHAWAPYFEDANAIIFLAPISAFDQVLAEDPKVNRLEDSLLLWKSLVSNKLLANVSVILFLNKIDLLQGKLKAGVRLRDYIQDYEDRSNDYEHVSKYFHNKFAAIHQGFSVNAEREIKIHFTSVTDTRRTATIIQSVREIIIANNLRNLQLM